MARLLIAHRRVLWTTARIELDKRYSGSLLGRAWVVLYPLLFLSVYLFLYLVIFKIRLAGFSQLDYVAYIFCGLVPYIAFMEAASGGAVAIKQNIHLIRNVFLPMELIPARIVVMALVSEAIGLVMLVILTTVSGSLSIHIALLPVAIVIQVVFLLGVALLISPPGLLLPDVAYFTNLLVLFVLFVTPIAFKPDAVPAGIRFIVWLNPIYYLLAPFRAAVLGKQPIEWDLILVAMVLAGSTFWAGSALFARCKGFLVDHE